MSEIELKVANIKAKRDSQDVSSMAWQSYNEVLNQLQSRVPITLKVHVTPEICDSCQ